MTINLLRSRPVVSGAIAIALVGWASAGFGQRRGPDLRPAANPGEIVATELAFGRVAREKGQWTAFAEYAAKDAVMFVPEKVRAHQWLKGRANPAQTAAWEPYQVWSSCDGSLAATKGAWNEPDGTTGYFTTIWQRQEKGEYRWVIDQRDTLAQPLVEPDLVQADIADCPQRGIARAAQPAGSKPIKPPKRGRFLVATVAADGLSGSSNDGSLNWRAAVGPDTARELHVLIRKGDGMKEVLASLVAVPAE